MLHLIITVASYNRDLFLAHSLIPSLYDRTSCSHRHYTWWCLICGLSLLIQLHHGHLLQSTRLRRWCSCSLVHLVSPIIVCEPICRPICELVCEVLSADASSPRSLLTYESPTKSTKDAPIHPFILLPRHWLLCMGFVARPSHSDDKSQE